MEERLKSAEIDMRENERVVLLRTVDERWMEHIDAMDQLKQGIGLRSYAQSDPVYAYTSEGFEMFDAMVAEIREQTVRRLYQMQVTGGPLRRVQLAKPIEAQDGRGERHLLAQREEGRPQRPLPLRQRQEVQELPRQERMTPRRAEPTFGRGLAWRNTA